MAIRLNYIKYRNFLRVRDEVIKYFDEKGTTLIIGKNGIGKSTEIKAILFAAYGKTYESIRGKSAYVNNHVNKDCMVELSVTFDGKEIIITRYIEDTIHKGNTFVTVDGESVPDPDYFENYICSYDIFIRTIIFPQQAKETFLELPNGKKFELFSNITTDLSRYSLLLEKAKIYKEKMDGFVDTVQSKLDSIDQSIENISNIKNVNKIKFDEEKKSTIEKKNQYLIDINNLKTSIGNTSEDKVKDELVSEKNLLNNINELNNNIINNAEISKSNELNRYNNSLSSINNDKVALDNKFITEYNLFVNNDKEKLVTEMNGYSEKINEILTTISNYESTIKEKNSTIIELNKREINILNSTINELNIEYSKLLTTKSYKENEISKFNNAKLYVQNEVNNAANCVTCGRPLTPECVDVIDNQIKSINDELGVLNTQIQISNNKIKEVKDKIKSFEDKNTSIIDEMNANINTNKLSNQSLINNLNTKKNEIKIKLDSKEIENKYHLELTKKYENDYNMISEKINNENMAHVNNMKTIEDEKIKSLAGITEKISRSSETIKKLENIISIFNLIRDKENDIKVFDQIILKEFDSTSYDNNIQNLKIEQDKLIQTKTKTINEILPIVSFWVEAFSDKGIKNYIIGTKLPYINDRINSYLTSMGKNLLVTIDNCRELSRSTSKTKAISNEIHIRVLVDNKEVDIKLLSGGQKRLIDIIIFFTLYEILVQQKGKLANVLYFDEIFDALDNENTIDIMNILKTLSEKSEVRIITHSDVWKQEEFDNIIDYNLAS